MVKYFISVSDFKSDVTVPVDDSTDALTRWDSYENFGKVGEGKDIGRHFISFWSEKNRHI